MNNNQKHRISKNIIYISIWAGWITFLIWISYQTRFWINNDTIGSLDTARYLKNFEFLKAVNSYWGSGYGLILSMFPLDNLHSWFSIHLLVSLLVLFSQYALYKTLRFFNIANSLSTLIVFFWGISIFVTGGAFFITSDALLCTIGSFYILVASHSQAETNYLPPSKAILLGILHGIASITKAIAFYGLMIYPIILLLRNLIYGEKRNLFKTVTFSLGYLSAFVIIISFWCAGIQYKYGRLTFSDSPSWNYALFVEHSPDLNEAVEKGKQKIPLYGTYWWSDIGASSYDGVFKNKFNFKKQIKYTYDNINYFIKYHNKKDIFIKFITVLSIILLITFTINSKAKYLTEKLLGFVGLFILLIYVQVSLQARFLPFPLLFLMPILAIAIDKNLIINNKIKNGTIILLILAILHGILVIVLASLSAPNNAHFKIKNIILKNGFKNNNLLGAYLINNFIDHNAVIAFLLKTKTGEIISKDNTLSKFTASFEPQYVLIETNPTGITKTLIAVNGKHFNQLYATLWKKGAKESKLILYENSRLAHNIPN